MILNPIIPIWLMLIISIILIYIILKYSPKSLKLIKILIVILLFIINLRIMYKSDNSMALSNDLNVLFVIDSTISMNAEDYTNSTRLKELQSDCSYIIDQLNGARFSVITFNNNSKILTPFTKDAEITKSTIEIISTLSEYYGRGSSLNTPQKDMEEILKNSQGTENRTSIVFFMSDGEITDDSKLKSYKDLSKYIDNGAVIGYGTNVGGYMKTANYNGDTSYVIDRTNNNFKKAVSKIDEDNLQEIANDLDINYILRKKQNNLTDIVKKIKNSTSSELSEDNKAAYEDTYFIFVIPLFILLILNYKKYKEEF